MIKKIIYRLLFIQMKQYYPNNFESLDESHLVKGMPLVMILNNPLDSSSKVVSENIKWAMNYSKIPFITRTVSNKNKLDIPSSVKVICYTAYYFG